MTTFAVVVDFDGTAAQQDVGNEILARFAASDWYEHELRWYDSQLTGRELHVLQFGTIQAPPEEVARYAKTFPLDPGFANFAAFCRDNDIPLAIASEGCDIYIRAILERERLTDIPVFVNGIRFESDGIRMTYPHGNPLCHRCGNCKVGVVQWYRSQGHRVIFAGDGNSDRYAALVADVVFAKDRLARMMEQLGAPYLPYTSFVEVQQQIEDIVKGQLKPPELLPPQRWSPDTLPRECLQIEDVSFVGFEKAQRFFAGDSK